MKQIIPFQRELLFKTKVSEITSISLEHTLSLTSEDLISGEFHISGDYKMTEGSINREQFDFKLPFEITLNDKYIENSLIIDIDNFYYEIVNNEALKINIDVYIDGKKEEENDKRSNIITETTTEEVKEETQEENHPLPNLPEVIIDREEELDKEIEYQKKDKYYLDEDNNSVNFNIFENIDNSDTYVTYHVYIVKENDTIDKIMDKFHVSKEDITQYNNLEDIKPGVKLIIPNSNE